MAKINPQSSQSAPPNGALVAAKGEPRYRDLKKLFDDRWLDLTTPTGTTNLKEVAKRIAEAFDDSTVPSRLRSYRYGARRPKSTEIDTVAGWFFNSKWKKDASQHAVFSRQLAEAAGYRRDGLSPSAHYGLSDLRAGTELRVGGIQYSHFCNPERHELAPGMTTGFVDILFERFLRFSSLRAQNNNFIPVDLADAIEQLATAKLQVVLGILATADRLLDLEFFSFPIRVGLNAVIRGADSMQENDVKDVLSKRSDSKEIRNIIPVILPMEVGGIYVEKGLYWQGHLVKVQKLDARQYAEAIRKLEPQQVGVAVADEISCLEIEQQMKREGISAKLLFPLSGSRNQTPSRLPQYMLAFATHVDAKDFKRHLRQAFELYVDADDEWVVYEYLGLVGYLAERAAKVLAGDGRPTEAHKDSAVRWALHQLRLMHNDYFPANCIFPDTLRQEAVERLHQFVAARQEVSLSRQGDDGTARQVTPPPALADWILDTIITNIDQGFKILPDASSREISNAK